MESIVEFTFKDSSVRGAVVAYMVNSLFISVLASVVGAPFAVVIQLFIIITLIFAGIESRRMYRELAMRGEQIEKLEAEIEKACGPRLTKFLIDEPRLKLSTTDTKRILIGLYQVKASGRPIAAEENMRELELWDWSPDSHNDIARAPYYGKPERDPRTERYIMKIFDSYYTLPKSYKP